MDEIHEVTVVIIIDTKREEGKIRLHSELVSNKYIHMSEVYEHITQVHFEYFVNDEYSYNAKNMRFYHPRYPNAEYILSIDNRSYQTVNVFNKGKKKS